MCQMKTEESILHMYSKREKELLENFLETKGGNLTNTFVPTLHS